MIENENLGAQVLANPSAIQYMILKNIFQRTLGTEAVCIPANNAFCTLLDASASVTSQFVLQMNEKFDSLYACRATDESQLYPFLSDFDYVQFTASPCSLDLQILLSKDWIIKNAVPYDQNYSLLTIPETSTFLIAEKTFGLYYPIQIKVNSNNNVITTIYDVSTVNPLYSLSSNLPMQTASYVLNGVDYYRFVITTFQFKRTTHNITTSYSTGFSEVFNYDNQFYAVRVYSVGADDTLTEMSYSLSQMMYNANTPTAILTVSPSTSQLKIDIPQIYFDNNLITNQIKVVIYNTYGALNDPLSASDIQGISTNFDYNSSKYAAPFKNPATCIILPSGTTQLIGGSNGKNFMSLKNQIVSGSLYKKVPISSNEIEAYVSNLNYKFSKYIDNITDRIFYASNSLTFSNGNPVPVVVAPVIFNSTNLGGSVSTILNYSNNLYTILPTTTFQFNSQTNTSLPLTDAEVQSLSSLSKSDLISNFNANHYTRQPFHISLNTAQKYPIATSYNLMNPTMSDLIFLSDNFNLSQQISVSDIAIVSLGNGTGGFGIKLAVNYTAALADTSKDLQSIILYTTDKSGNMVYLQCAYLSTTTSTDDNTAPVDVYSGTLSTTYQFSTDGYLVFQLLDQNGNLVNAEIQLSQTWYLIGCISNTLETTPSVTPYTPPVSIPEVIQSQWIVTSQQSCTLTFGQNLSDMIFNVVTTTWGPGVYQTYSSDVYQTYSQTQYLKDTSGNLVFKTNSTTNLVELVPIHQVGDNVVSGLPISVSITATQITPTTTITISSTDYILVGAQITGPGIPLNTVVSSIDTTNSTITLSNAPADVTEGTTLTIQSGIINGEIGASSTTDTITVKTNNGILVGMSIFGLGIPTNTTVTAVNNTTLTLSNIVDVEENGVIQCFNVNGPFQLLHTKGDIVLDNNGNPITLQNPNNVYGVQMIQFDAKLYEAQDSQSTAYVASLASTLVNNAQALQSVRDVLLERTYLYYKPFKTVGTTTYNIGNNTTITGDLGISLTVTYYVDIATKSNVNLCNEMTTLTIESIASYLTSNQTYSTEKIADILKTQFSLNILALDVSGFWNNPNYHFISVEEDAVSPGIAYTLQQEINGTIQLVPQITVNFQLAPTNTTRYNVNQTTLSTTPIL